MIQLQFINALLDRKDKSLIMNYGITKDFFPNYQSEFQYIRDHLDKYDTIPDKATFFDKFPAVNNITVSETNEYLIDELYHDYNTRVLAAGFNKIKQLALKNDYEAAENAYMAIQDKLLKSRHIECTDITKDLSRYDDYVERTKDYGLYYVSTGFHELDMLIGGWDRNEELATIVARPGVGKSWVMLKCAIAALRAGLRVGIYSGEMSSRKVGYRFDALDGHISNYKISKGYADVQMSYKDYIDTLKDKYKNSCMYILEPADLGRYATVSDLRAFIETYNLDILFIDQYSFMHDERGGKTDSERTAHISTDLKSLQVLLKKPIIAVSQQNRSDTEATDGATTANIAQSDKIGQDSTIVLFLEQKDSILTIVVGKCRDSGTGKKLKYVIDLDVGIFEFMPEEEPVCEDSRDSIDAEQLYNIIKGDSDEQSTW